MKNVPPVPVACDDQHECKWHTTNASEVFALVDGKTSPAKVAEAQDHLWHKYKQDAAAAGSTRACSD